MGTSENKWEQVRTSGKSENTDTRFQIQSSKHAQDERMRTLKLVDTVRSVSPSTVVCCAVPFANALRGML